MQFYIKRKDVPFRSRNRLPRNTGLSKKIYFPIGDLKMLPSFEMHHIYVGLPNVYVFLKWGIFSMPPQCYSQVKHLLF